MTEQLEEQRRAGWERRRSCREGGSEKRVGGTKKERGVGEQNMTSAVG